MNKFTIIAGPCLIESEELALTVAAELDRISHKLHRDFDFNFVYKASFDKANRTSDESFRGVGIDVGVEVFRKIRTQFGLAITTDIHESEQANRVSEVVDVIQIPALLCRQTSLIHAAARTGKIVNIKKGQFMAPKDMWPAVTKARNNGCHEVWLTERGTTFGYGRLINDMTAIKVMRRMAPVIFDATHSVQEPNLFGNMSGGDREMVEVLARAAVAAGCDGLFFETHPNPDKALSDGPCMVPLDQMEKLLTRMLKLRAAVVNL